MKKNFIKGFVVGGLLFGTLTSFAAVSYDALTATFPIFVNGQKWESDKPVVVIEGSTYLPLKALGDVLDVNVKWNSEARQVEINKVELASPFSLTDGQYVVGEDINPGKYDLKVNSGAGNLMGQVKSLGFLGLNEIMADKDNSTFGENNDEYKNLRLQNGDKFTISGGLNIEFTEK